MRSGMPSPVATPSTGSNHIDRVACTRRGVSVYRLLDNRPGLDRATRSLLNLAMLTVLHRPHELKLHVRGAIHNGVSKEQIQEVFLQTAIYCGVPAAIDSFRGAREVFKEMGI